MTRFAQFLIAGSLAVKLCFFASVCSAQLDDAIELAAEEGDWALAITLGDSLVSELRSQDPTPGSRLEAALFRLGESRYYGEGPTAALPHFRQCVEILESRSDVSAHIVLARRNAFAECLRATGEYGTAAEQFDLALELIRSLPEEGRHPCEEAEALNNIAGFYKDLEQLDRAEPLLLDALDLSLDCGGQRRSNSHLNLAEVYRLQFRLDEAARHYEDALRIARAVYGPTNYLLVYPLNQCAEARRLAGDIPGAVRLRREALELVEALDPPRPIRLGQVLHDLAEDYLLDGRPALAIEAARKAAKVRQSVHDSGHVDVVASRLVAADAMHRASPDETTPALAIVDGQLELLGDDFAASSVRAEGLALRARLLEARGKVRQAIESLEACSLIVDQNRARLGGIDVGRARYLAEHRRIFESLARIHLESGNLPGAFSAVERSRARVLEERLEERLARPRTLANGGDEQKLQSLRSQITALNQERSLLEWGGDGVDETLPARLERYDDRLDSLATAYAASLALSRRQGPSSPGARTASVPIGLEAARDLIAPGGIILSYFLGESGGHGLLIPHEGEAVAFSLPSADEAASGSELEKLLGSRTNSETVLGMLSEGRRRLRRRSEASLRAKLLALRRVLVPDSIWRRVEKSTEAVIIPDGRLHLLPFEALVVEDDSSGPVYWLDAGPPVRYASSATTLSLLASRQPRESLAAGTLLSVGASDFMPAGLPASDRITARRSRLGRLPWAISEVEAVVAAWGEARSTKLAAEQATETAVRAALPEHSLLHFATHGIVDEDAHSLRASLALAPPVDSNRANGDGFLQLHELLEMRLSARLAVLSACETQLGEFVEGEGSFALSRGFLLAGAQSVVATLWSVDDEASKELVARFFMELAGRDEDDAPVIQSLRGARRWIRNHPQWEAPYFWAPFTLRGTR